MRKLENGVEATRNALAEGLSVYSPIINFGKGRSTTGIEN